MPWNASKPADSDRIRLSAALIRENFDALELGTVPYDTLSLQNQASFPALTAHNRIYGYTNVISGQVELLSVNPAGNTVFLTEGGKIGSTTQNAIFANVIATSFTLGTITNTQNAFCNGWVSFDDLGAILGSYNVTSVTKLSTGVYQIVWSIVLSSSNYCVNATAKDTAPSGHNKTAMVVAQTTTSVTIRLQRIDQSSGNFRDTACCVSIFGGR